MTVAEQAAEIASRMEILLKDHPPYYNYPPASAGTVRDLANVVRDLARIVEAMND
ncbi:hypothetical protein [Mycobacterium sp. CnD-18-1]|uniref:hypothetical protein n=1 Tax=Mycobacterium sp. CnD-18-1 TaxID=2917744 RepID=UPI001EF373E3|nr:hypothetical protein [Mycobacterium sp. CnD-18-1]MCG7607176.1 hypothetical protein [Mycobacterium sp. CnD-18-1]